MSRRISENEESAIIAAYLDGDLVNDIAQAFGVNRDSIHKIIARNAIPRRGRGIGGGGGPRPERRAYEERLESYTTPHISHGATDLDYLDYRLSKSERAAAQLKSYFDKEQSR